MSLAGLCENISKRTMHFWVREVVKKSKWKFKMAFAMKGGLGRVGLVWGRLRFELGGGLDQAFCLVGSGRGRLSASLVEGFFG